MTYNKPEITNLGDAAGVIHGMPKAYPAYFEFVTGEFDFVPAYDLDE